MSGAAPGGREVAQRVFAAEFDDATASFTHGDEERSPNYVIGPSGVLMNRIFLVGVLTACERVTDETVRARIADPTGVFVIYASQYQPDARASLLELEVPSFVAITGKANTFVPDGSDRALTSVRPEAVARVDAGTRDHWTVSTAEHTLARLGAIASVRLGRGDPTDGITRAIDAYDPTDEYLDALYELCLEALEIVAGERDGTDRRIDPSMTSNEAVSLDRLVAVGEEMGMEAPPRESSTAPDPPSPDPPDDPPDVSEERVADEPVVTADEREAIETEFGTEFETGDEVDPPEPPAEEPDQASEVTDGADESTEEEAELSDEVVEILRELDGGDGVERPRILDAASERLSADRESIDDALRTAMMDGQCYEPAEDVLRPI